MSEDGESGRGVSSIVGSVLIIAIIVVMAVIVGGFVLTTNVPDKNSPSISITDSADGEVVVDAETMGTAEAITVDYSGQCNIIKSNGSVEEDVPCKITSPDETLVIPNPSGPINVIGQHAESTELLETHDPAGNTVSADSPNFTLKNVNSSAPIDAGNTLIVNLTVENTGSESDVQDITVVLEDTSGNTVDTATKRVSLDTGAQKTYAASAGNAFKLSTTSNDIGTHNLTANSDDDSVNKSVTLNNNGHPPKSWCTNSFLASASGTTSDRHAVSNVYELQCMAAAPSEHYKLVSNIDASETAQSSWHNGSGFDPVGHPDNYLTASGGPAFTGSLQGQGYTVSGLTIDRGSTTSVGLFGHASTATVSEFTVSSADITGADNTGVVVGKSSESSLSSLTSSGTVSGGNHVGGLLGTADGSGTTNLSSSSSTATVSGTNYVGGAVGGMSTGWGVDIDNTDAHGNVNGDSQVGGLVGGGTSETIDIANSNADGDVDGSTNVGGLVGLHPRGTLTGSSSSSFVNGTEYVGGLVGQGGDADPVNSSNDRVVTIQDSTASGTIQGSTEVGGLLGFANAATLDNTAATGSVTASGKKAGGLVGYVGFSPNNQIDASHATGTVDGEDYVGGLVGDVRAEHDSGAYTIRDSYATGDVTGNRKVGGLVGLTSTASHTLFVDTHALGDVSGTNRVGGLVASLAADGTVKNSYAENNVITGTTHTGGLVGLAAGNGRVVDSYSDNDVTGESNTGGLVGMLVDSSAVENSTSHSTVQVAAGITDSWANTGGLVGKLDDSSRVANSTATGDVTGSNNTGGLVGYTESGKTVSNSAAEGAIDGERRVGGLVGSSVGTDINNSYATGSVTGDTATGGGIGLLSSATASYSHANGSVSGTDKTGGFAAYISSSGTVYESYASGDVSGDTNTGGLVGDTTGGAHLYDTYARGDVTGDTNTGGLVGNVGNSADTVEDSYASGVVDGSDSDSTGGVAGAVHHDAVLDDTYWDTTVNSNNGGTDHNTGYQPDHSGVTGLTTDEMTDYAAIQNMDLDFENTWAATDSYPVLRNVSENWSEPEGVHPYKAPDSSYCSDHLADASGTSSDPHIITTAHELQCMQDAKDAYHQLGSDVDASNTAKWNSGKGFSPVGGTFTGTLDGNGYTISGLTIDRGSTDMVGLFSTVGKSDDPFQSGDQSNPGYVQDLTLANVDVVGYKDMGALAGDLQKATVDNVDITGNVHSNWGWVGGYAGNGNHVTIKNSVGNIDVFAHHQTAGGFVGWGVTGVKIRSSAFHGTIDNPEEPSNGGEGLDTSGQNTGGLIGSTSNRNNVAIKNSYSTATIIGGEYSGGLAGYVANRDDYGDGKLAIKNSYSTSDVTGDDEVGGLVGKVENGFVEDSFSTGSVSGSTNVGGSIGKLGRDDDTNNIQASFTDVYWNTSPSTPSSDTGSDGDRSGITQLTESQMTGSDADYYMSGLDFSNTWTTTSSFPDLTGAP